MYRSKDQNEIRNRWMNRERWYLLIGFEGFEWKGEFEGCERKRKMGDHDGPTMMDRLCLETEWKNALNPPWVNRRSILVKNESG